MNIRLINKVYQFDLNPLSITADADPVCEGDSKYLWFVKSISWDGGKSHMFINCEDEFFAYETEVGIYSLSEVDEHLKNKAIELIRVFVGHAVEYTQL